jgi:lysophospholipase L1-like esterase
MTSARARLLRGALAAAIGVCLVSCSAIAPDAAPPPTADGQTRVAFYGDSYTLGTGASSEDKRWSTAICQKRGWAEFNPSVNGLGFVNNRRLFGEGDLPDQVIASDPDIVFVTMGLNDNFSYDRVPGRIYEQIGDDLQRISAAVPDARVVVVEPFWYTDSRPESVDVIITWVRDAAAAVGAEWIPGASRWLEGHPEWMAADGLHPNDAGYAELTRRMDAELARLGL